jgi:hypothetical protein
VYLGEQVGGAALAEGIRRAAPRVGPAAGSLAGALSRLEVATRG